MVCKKCSKTMAEGKKFCSACGAPLQADEAPKPRLSKLSEKLETVKTLGKVACCAAVIGVAAASSMSGQYIPATGLGDDSPAPQKKQEQTQPKADKSK
jgi:hypothetical protein